MSTILAFVVGAIVLLVLILLVRLFGAWMLRIDEVIKELKGLRADLQAKDKTSNNE